MTVAPNPKSFLAFAVRVATHIYELDLRPEGWLNPIEREHVEDQRSERLDSYRQLAYAELRPVDERQRAFADESVRRQALLLDLLPTRVPTQIELVNRTIAGVHEAVGSGNRTATAKVLNRKNRHECVRDGALEGHHVRNRLLAYADLDIRGFLLRPKARSAADAASILICGLRLHAAEAAAAWRLWSECPEVRREPELHLATRPGLLKAHCSAVAAQFEAHPTWGTGPVLRAILERAGKRFLP